MRFIKKYNLKFPAISAFAKTKHCANCVREFGQQFSGEEGKGLVVVLCLHVLIVKVFLIGVDSLLVSTLHCSLLVSQRKLNRHYKSCLFI